MSLLVSGSRNVVITLVVIAANVLQSKGSNRVSRVQLKVKAIFEFWIFHQITHRKTGRIRAPQKMPRRGRSDFSDDEDGAGPSRRPRTSNGNEEVDDMGGSSSEGSEAVNFLILHSWLCFAS